LINVWPTLVHSKNTAKILFSYLKLAQKGVAVAWGCGKWKMGSKPLRN